jgi:hypothetical protein
MILVVAMLTGGVTPVPPAGIGTEQLVRIVH